jgi:HAE1 family hydrophobic/amphiphilic exporter-1
MIGLMRTPTGFLPTEDQGYIMVAVQLPDGSALGRAEVAMQQLSDVIRKVPGVAETNVIGGSGSSPIDSSASLFNSGVIYAVLTPSSERGRSEDLNTINRNMIKAVATVQEANCLVMLPPPIQGLGLSDGFQMQVELSNGTFDYDRLQNAAQAIVTAANKEPSITNALSPFRADVPQLSFQLNRREATTYGVNISDVFDALETYLGST